MYYDPGYKVFIGFPNKARHLKILETYFNNTISQTNISKTITENMTWHEIGKQVDSMFSQQYGNLSRTAVHFYGNDGVCLFKYFVRSDDARRSRVTSDIITDITNQNGDVIVWLMLGLNLACFILITVCYVLIILTTVRSSKQSGSDQNPNQIRVDRELQNRIAAIIATDFLCWVPFIIISALHNLNVIDATVWYVPFAMIVLPINSIINPLIYDKKLRERVSGKIQPLFTTVCNSRVFVSIQRTWQSRIGDITNDEIELKPIQNLPRRLQEDVIEPAECQIVVNETAACGSGQIVQDNDDRDQTGSVGMQVQKVQ